MTEYIAIIHKDENSDYGISFPDFPGCVTAGKTIEEAQELAREALELHIRGINSDQRKSSTPLTDINFTLKFIPHKA